jgi:hypothetical protein
MDHTKIIASFASTEKCCETYQIHCPHNKYIACNRLEDTGLDERYCLQCISGIFHTSLDETRRERAEKRTKIAEGPQFLATGFADGNSYQYEYVNTGETFFLYQEPSSAEIIHAACLKWLEKPPCQSIIGEVRPLPLCKKGEEFNGLVHSQLKQKTLDDYLSKKT